MKTKMRRLRGCKIIQMDEVLSQMSPAIDSGDGVHLNDSGVRRLVRLYKFAINPAIGLRYSLDNTTYQHSQPPRNQPRISTYQHKPKSQQGNPAEPVPNTTNMDTRFLDFLNGMRNFLEGMNPAS